MVCGKRMSLIKRRWVQDSKRLQRGAPAVWRVPLVVDGFQRFLVAGREGGLSAGDLRVSTL